MEQQPQKHHLHFRSLSVPSMVEPNAFNKILILAFAWMTARTRCLSRPRLMPFAEWTTIVLPTIQQQTTIIIKHPLCWKEVVVPVPFIAFQSTLLHSRRMDPPRFYCSKSHRWCTMWCINLGKHCCMLSMTQMCQQWLPIVEAHTITRLLRNKNFKGTQQRRAVWA